jgi:glycine cleavage system aminomethyltransferase T
LIEQNDAAIVCGLIQYRRIEGVAAAKAMPQVVQTERGHARHLALDMVWPGKNFRTCAFVLGILPGLASHLYRVSFSGELEYEINGSSNYAIPLWTEPLLAGAGFGITPHGLEASLIMRMEKWFPHVVDTDGTISPQDVGWERCSDEE